jgi:hypothetical protein
MVLAGTQPESTVKTAVSPKVAAFLHKRGFQHVAGNIYELPSKQELWEVRGGSIVKLTGSKIDAGEELVAASADNPEASLQNFLYDLTF